MPSHSYWIRLCHWLVACHGIALIFSGWAIYNAAPFLPIDFPTNWTLGADLTQALRWHLALAWMLSLSTLVLLLIRGTSRNSAPALYPRFNVAYHPDNRGTKSLFEHRLGHYNVPQQLTYIAVYILLLLAILSGLGLWKPVQLQLINQWVGGYENMRRVHFAVMVLIAGFAVAHIAMVLLVPKTLLSMVFGQSESKTDAELNITGAKDEKSPTSPS